MSTTPPGFDETKFVLGSLCKRGHDWEGTGRSLRRARNSYCIDCQRCNNAAYSAANAEKKRAYNSAYHAANTGKARAYRAANAEKIRSWRAANSDKRRAYNTFWRAQKALDPAWRLANAEKKRAQMAAYYLANAKAMCSAKREYYHANRKKCLARMAAYRIANPERMRASKRRRRDRKAAAPALQHITFAQICQRRKVFNCKCAFCAEPDPVCGKKPPMDHFLPLSLGNALTLGNAIPTCQRCNGSKNNADPWEWYSRQPFFDQKRWDQILKVLSKENIHHGQMVLV